MKKNNGKKIALAAVILVLVVAVVCVVYANFGPKAVSGSKEVTIEVTDDAGEMTTYEVKTDAEFLRQAMDEAEGLTYGGTESEEYGMMIDTINGLTADYATDGAYWSIYVDGEYGMYGVDSQPVEDGHTYQFVYTLAE